MADTDEITRQVEAVSQPHDNDKLSESKTSENTASAASQGAVLSNPQPQAQQQQSQPLLSTQINASISGNASPQLFQVQQQQPGQAPQTMALINGQLVPVSTVHVQVPVAGSVSDPVVLPQVQVQVQGPAAVNMQASIVQKQSTTEGSTSTSTQQKTNAPESKLEKIEITSNVPHTTTQSQTNNNASPASRKTQDPGCGCGFWAAILSLFQQKPQTQQNDDDNKNSGGNDQTTTVNNNTQNDKTKSPSLGTTAVNMAIQAINPAAALAPAAQGDSSQVSRNIGMTDVGQNTTAINYPLGTNDISTVNATNNQGVYAMPTNIMIPDTGQYLVPAQQTLYVVDASQAVPAPYPGQAPDQATADGTYVDGGEGGDDLVDDGYDDADDM